MYDIQASLDKQILGEKRNKPTVIFTEPSDPRAIEAVCFLLRFIRPVFLSTKEDVSAIMQDKLGHIDPSRIEFALSESAFVVPSENPELLKELAEACVKLPEGMSETTDYDEALKMVSEPAMFGIMAVKQGHADCVVGGLNFEPRDFFRPMTRILAKQKVISEAGVFILPDDYPEDIFPHNIMVVGDIGVNAKMDADTLAHVAVGTCAIARDIFPEEVLPIINGALVSYSNRGSDEGNSAERVRKAGSLIPDVLAGRVAMGSRYRHIKIESEMKISVALSKKSAYMYGKGQEKSFEGGANVIVAPNLDAGNLLYHLYATRYPEAKKFSVLYGLRFQGVDLSMDGTTEDAILSVKASVLRMLRFGEWEFTPKDTFFPSRRILAINPGSTSTKIAVYQGDRELFMDEIQHTIEELEPYEGKRVVEQYEMRKALILKALNDNGITVDSLDAVSGRGGLLRPIPHGTYPVNDRMKEDLLSGTGVDHASNLGALIARELAAEADKPAFIVDPVVVDEVPEKMKITGFKEMRRDIVSHALNQIATARRYAEENETFYQYLNLVVCHMGGGISCGAHAKGRYIDVNNALDGEGAFTPQRSGGLPVGPLIRLCFSGKYTMEDLLKMNKGRGGMIDLIGTADFREIENRVKAGEPEVVLAYEAMVYQLAKNITALLPAFKGEPIDQVLLTGGVARCQMLVDDITELVGALGCGVTTYPGENEMQALVKGAARVLEGKEEPREYNPKN